MTSSATASALASEKTVTTVRCPYRSASSTLPNRPVAVGSRPSNDTHGSS
ncbi:hypothetical protein AB5J72_37465 [Streptomyces sp. CG1]